MTQGLELIIFGLWCYVLAILIWIVENVIDFVSYRRWINKPWYVKISPRENLKNLKRW